MPDSTSFPSFPAVLRDYGQRESEQGVEAPLRIAARRPLAAVNGSVRPLLSPHGKIARAEQVGTRWRDIQWVDFTSDPNSGGAAAAPEPVETFEPVKMPEVEGALRHFGKSPATAPAPKADAIPGLATRFTRLSVPRLSPVPPRPPAFTAEPLPPTPAPVLRPVSAPLAALVVTSRTAAGNLVVHPRIPSSTVAAAATATALRLQPWAEKEPEEKTDRPFPASISIHVSTAAEADEPAPSGRWLVALATGIERAVALRRGAQAAMGMALAAGLDRSQEVLWAGCVPATRGRVRPGAIRSSRAPPASSMSCRAMSRPGNTACGSPGWRR
jgi:hypothetical protein